MNPIGIFHIPARYDAVLNTGSTRNSNMPLHNTTIKVYKGSNSTLEFVLLDADAKPIDYNGSSHIEFRVYNTRTRRQVISRRVEKKETETSISGTTQPTVSRNNKKRSIFSCPIYVSDTADLPTGTMYSWSIVQLDAYGNGDYFQTTLHDTVTGELHIVDNGQPQVEPSSVLLPENFTAETTYGFLDPAIVGDSTSAMKLHWTRYHSEAVPGDLWLNTFEGLHTIAIYPENFTGVIQLQGTLETTPPQALNDNRWFNIPFTNREVNINCINSNSIIPLNFVGNFVWIRVVYYVMEPTEGISGQLKRVVIRR